MTAINFPIDPDVGDTFLNFIWDGEKWRDAGARPAAFVLTRQEQFDLSVAADDSTLRTISTGESIKFTGAGGITTASDAEGAITITQGATDRLVSGSYSAVLANTGVLTVPGNVIPPTSGLFTLGDATHKWADVWIGPNTLNIQDQVTNLNAALTIQNGTLFIDNAQRIQIGQMAITTTGISLVAGGSSQNIIVGALLDTGYTQLANLGLQFRDGSRQTTASVPYSFNVAADDSTQRAISNNELIKFIGAGGITTESDAEGNITITSPSLAAVATSGSYTDLTNKPTLTTSLAALTDVNVAGAIMGQVLTYDNITQRWIPGGSGGGATGALGYYGSFYDVTATQPNAGATSANLISIGGVYESNGITIVSGSKITFSYAGTYSVVFSLQFVNDNAAEQDVSVWLKTTLNGSTSNVADSTVVYTIDADTGNLGKLVAINPFILTVSAGEQIQVYWQSPSIDVYLKTIAAQTSPSVPRAPAVILTVEQTSSIVVPDSIAGNAATATRLQTARRINGLVFDGTADITIPQYSFNVAADDSTQRLVSSDEVIKFIGAGTVTTSSDAEGNITITGPTLTSQLTNNSNYIANLTNTRLELSTYVASLTAPDSISIQANAAGWTFRQDSKLQFPDSTFQTTAYTGNAATVTNGVYTTGSYADPSWITSLAGSKVTNAVLTTGSYANPSWITSLAYSKLTGVPVQPAPFTFNVAADDSTLRTIDSEETVKFVGAGGITTASDAEGTITLTGTVYPTTLAGLSDTTLAGVSNNQVLTYNTAISKWIPTTVNGVSTLPTGIAYYGSFYDVTATQTATSITTAYVVAIGATAEANGVTITSGNRITFAYAGTYEIQFSIQFHNVETVASNVNVWFRLNGTDIADSNSTFTIPSKNNNNGYLIAVSPYLVTVTAGQYVQLVWNSVDNTTTIIETVAAKTNPTVPRTPGVIVLVNPVTALITPTTVASLTVTGATSTGSLVVTNAATATSYDTEQITIVGNRIATTVTNANLELEPNGTGSILTSSGTLVGTQTTQNVFNTTATTVNAFGAATTLNLGGSTGTTTVNNNLSMASGKTIGTTGTVTANAATAFIAGDAAISGVALQIPQEGAIRNLYNGTGNNMYFDVSIGGTSQGQFQFRSSSAYTNVLTMSSIGVTFNTGATVTARTASIGRLPFNSAIDTELTIDDYRFRVTSSTGIFPQIISNVSGQTKNSAWTAVGAISGTAVNQVGSTGNLVPNNAWVNLYDSHGMDSSGDTVTVTLQDKALGRIYRVTFMRSDAGTVGYNIIAERLL